MSEVNLKELEEFIKVVRQLRDPEHGCPWDRVQTMDSLKRFLIEEAAEFHDAIDSGDVHEIKCELGDLLMQVVLNAQVADDNGWFNLGDVAASEREKMVRRHPHVFGGVVFEDDAARRADWEKKKLAEASASDRKSVIDGVARSMPALARAQKISEKATRIGFEWPSPKEALEKVREELSEVEEAMAAGETEHIAEELGDVLFATTVLCRMEKVQAEEVLHAAVGKFTRRFKAMEANLPEHADIDTMIREWKKAKEGK